MSDTVPKQVLTTLIAQTCKRLLRTVRLGSVSEKQNSFVFFNGDVQPDIMERYQFDDDRLQIYAGGLNHDINIWYHYIPIYDRYFSKWRNTSVRLLEIGVWKGGSLELWRKYLGDDAIIYGIDIDKKCQEYDGINGCVRIGSQVDTGFLEAVVQEMGGIDIVLNDGGHKMKNIMVSLKSLFPRLNDGGVYLIEDLHTAYWRKFGGRYAARSNFFEFVRELIDDMHR